MIDKLCEEIFNGENVRENLIQLNQMIKEADFLDRFLDEYYQREEDFMGLLDHPDAKVRKNGIKLLGRVADEVLLEPLFCHYQAEETQFLKSEYLSALENFDYKSYLPQLQARWETLSVQEQTKHTREELKQLKKLIWKLDPPKPHRFIGDGMENKLLFLVPAGSEGTILEAMTAIPETSGKTMNGGCLVTTKRMKEVCQIRMYQAVLFDFYPVTIPSIQGGVIGERILKAGLVEYLTARHEESQPFLFRVEVKGLKEAEAKNRLARDLSLYLEEQSQGKLLNEPSFYEVEIRVIVGKKGSRIFLKLASHGDDRFNYRKCATSTSMHPSRAALAVHYLKPYIRPEANVLDPFCGTGTLLIEREKAFHAKSLYGLDISGQALQAAWENSRRADVALQLVQRNFNDFRHEYLFDEIITDMPRPSGPRMTRETEYVYELLFSKSRDLLAPKGILMVYSENAERMEQEIQRASWLSLLEKYSLGKNHSSWIYIMQKAER